MAAARSTGRGVAVTLPLGLAGVHDQSTDRRGHSRLALNRKPGQAHLCASPPRRFTDAPVVQHFEAAVVRRWKVFGNPRVPVASGVPVFC
eukprot:7478267-Pyramimonas_sp.AAC.1